ncbi:MAG: GNAT family N-acetyltransferase [Woeseiaceae bacterium]
MIASILDTTKEAAAAGVLVRLATRADLPQIALTQTLSIRELGKGFYSWLQIESFMEFMPMMEHYLIDDGTYFVAEHDGRIIGCGGWSCRSPSYRVCSPGGQPAAGRSAKVRAMYVHPDAARRGIGRTLLERIEREMTRSGHKEASLEAILPGVPLYRNRGYRETGATRVEFPNGVHLPVICMHKRLAPRGARSDAR